MDYANYKNDQSKYPVSVNTLDFIQEQIKFVMKLTGMAGKRVILKDCTAAEDGLVIIDDELYILERGYPSSYITINSTSETITAKGVVYNDARVRTYARYISYPAGYPTSDFIKVNNLTELTASLQHHVPKGTIIDWYGEAAFDNIPYGWVPCGYFYKRNGGDYHHHSASQEVIDEANRWKSSYSNILTETTCHYIGSNYSFLRITKVGDMEIPNLSGRFIVGAGYSGTTSLSQYDAYSIGGEEKHKLKANESGLPAHTHAVKAQTDCGVAVWQEGNYDGEIAGTGNGAVVTVDVTGTAQQCDTKDADVAHENRPPYFALYKLIKVI